MDFDCCEDVLLEKVAEGLKELATCYLKMPTSSSTSSRQKRSCWPIRQKRSCWPIERIILLQCRSKDVLSEFSGYYCLRLLLDHESPLATYFIDLFHQLEWLLEAMLTRSTRSPSLSAELYQTMNRLLHSIKPAANSCRYLFFFSQLPPTASSRWLSTAANDMKRDVTSYRDFSRDLFRCSTRMLSFVNLDQWLSSNMVKLGTLLGSGSYADVYKGNFMTRNHRDQSLWITGEPVAVKVFRHGNFIESAGPSRSIGSQFFDQMEKMVELQNMKKECQNTSSMTAGERLLLVELWMLVSAKHPNIVTARGFIGNRPPYGESGLVMELMDTSLQDHLEKLELPLKEVEMIDLMLEIAKGMRFLHECGLVHKDLKPRNILLRFQENLGKWKKHPAMEVKLADFGLTERFVPQSVVDSTPAGTYCYMAPEALHIAGYEAPYEDKLDVFSYGTTCFNILMCENPGALKFTSPESKDEFYEAVKSNDWRKRVEGKPEYLIDLIAKCWDFDPSRRPTFASICTLLQNAMLCILSPPVINVTTLSMFQYNREGNFLNLCRKIFRKSDIPYQIIGTSMMGSCLDELTSVLLHLKYPISYLTEDATLFLEAWNKIRGTAAKETANDIHGSKSFTTPVIRVEEQEHRFFRIPLKTMDEERMVSKALICSCMLDHFYDVDKHSAEISGVPQIPQQPQLFSFNSDDALSELRVDESLMPFLACFCIIGRGTKEPIGRGMKERLWINPKLLILDLFTACRTRARHFLGLTDDVSLRAFQLNRDNFP